MQYSPSAALCAPLASLVLPALPFPRGRQQPDVRLRPVLLLCGAPAGQLVVRNMFIQVADTPNPNSLMFQPGTLRRAATACYFARTNKKKRVRY